MSISATSAKGVSPGRAAFLAVVLVFVVYYLTAYRTIDWWDSAEYSLAAATMGVAHSPGALLLTWLGWLVSSIVPAGAVSFALNILASLIGSVTLLLLIKVIRRTIGTSDKNLKSQWIEAAALVCAVFTLGLGASFWKYSLKFSPYILTPTFTLLILLPMLAAIRPGLRDDRIFKWLFVAGLMIGLDFSVHRTNLLLVPAMLAVILLLQKRLRYRVKTWLNPILGGILGLSVHAFTMAMAAAQPFLNFGDPTNWSKFLDYVSLKQYGGGWLINLWPRKQPFFSGQVMDYLNDFVGTFSFNSLKWPFSWVIFVGVALYGGYTLWQRNRKTTVLLITLFLLTSVGAIVYFNTPANFFRSFDRHYIPSFVLFAIFLGAGVYAVLTRLCLGRGGRTYPVVAVILGLLAVALPLANGMSQYSSIDASERRSCYNFSVNILEQLQSNAIVFTGGDADTYPLWYVQQVEGIRPDVTVLNMNLLNTAWYLDELLIREPDFPVDFWDMSPDSLRPISWNDTTITYAVGQPEYLAQLPDSVKWPDSVTFTVAPTLSNQYILVADQFILNLLQTNRWKRPIYVASTAGSTNNFRSVANYLRNEGFAMFLLPVPAESAGIGPLERVLLDDYDYEGISDGDMPVSTPARWTYTNLYISFVQLAMHYTESGDTARALQTFDAMTSMLPYDRLEPQKGMRHNLEMYRKSLAGDIKPEGEGASDAGSEN